MAFLEKRNPLATRKSVITWACAGAVGGFALGLIAWLQTDTPSTSGYFVLPWMTLAGAVAGAAIEWQVYESE